MNLLREMPKLPNPPEADYLFKLLKTTERSETIILGIFLLDMFDSAIYLFDNGTC
jgi:hypothetical protein